MVGSQEMILFHIDPDVEEAQHEMMLDEMDAENFGFVDPAWKAWIHCPLFKWLDKRRIARDRAKAVRQSMEYARKFGLMMIESEKGIEFRKTAIIERKNYAKSK